MEGIFRSLEKEYRLIPQIVKYIGEEIIPIYRGFDSAHNVDHALKVISGSLSLSKYYDVNRNMVFAIAAYHDTGQINGRENHNIESGKILESDKKIKEWFSEREILIMKEAVEDHRASIDHAPRSIYGKIVAEADRIIDPINTIRRAVQFGLDSYPGYDKKQQIERVVNHVTDKYGRGGYLKLWIPESDNAKLLEELRLIIDDRNRLLSIIEEIYREESRKTGSIPL